MNKMMELPVVRNIAQIENRSLFFFFLFGEFLFIYSREASIGLVLSGISDQFGFVPIYSRYIFSVQLFIGSFLGIFIGLFTDLFLSKFLALAFSHIFSCFVMLLSTIISCMCTHNLVGSTLVSILLYSHFTFTLVGGLRYSFLADHIPTQRKTSSVRKNLFVVTFIRYLSIFTYGLLSLFPYERMFHFFGGFFMTVLNILYVAAFFILKSKVYFNKKNSSISENGSSQEFRNLYEKITDFLKNQKWLFIIALFLPFTSYGCISFMMQRVFYDQLTSIAYDENYGYPLPFNVANPYMTLLFLLTNEFIMKKGWKKGNWNDLHFISASIIVMSIPLGMLTLTQYICEKDSHFPATNYAQLVIYNGLSTDVTVKSALFRQRIIPSGEYYTIVIQTSSIEELLYYSYNNKNFTGRVELVGSQSTSYVINRNGLVRLLGFDPIYFAPPGFNKPFYPTVFVVTASANVFGEISFFSIKHSESLDVRNSFSKSQVLYDERIFFNLPPDDYYIKFQANGKTHLFNGTYSFRVGGVYSVVVYERGELYIGIKSLIDPCNYHNYQILIYGGLLIYSMAEAIGLVSLYTFSYYEIPQNFRNALFSYVYFAQTTGFAPHLWTNRVWYMTISHIDLLIFFASHLICATIFVIFVSLYKSETNRISN